MKEWEALSAEDKADWLDDDVTQAFVQRLERLIASQTDEVVATATNKTLELVRLASGRLRGTRDVLALLKGNVPRET